MTSRPSAAGSGPLSAIVVAGTHSGVGKTTVSIGLMAALRRKGLAVQPFKVGPDFIDPLHHEQACGRRSLNLDAWMLAHEVNVRRFARATAGADVAVIEGVMGLFDGSEGRSDRGSAGEMSRILGVPVMLVIDASAMARSAAALIHGFRTFDPSTVIAGVILNNVGGKGHADLIREAVDGAVPILGALPRSAAIVVPERHLGLHLPHEARASYIDRAAELIGENIDLDKLLLATRIRRGPIEQPPAIPAPRARIAVARDEAFCFYYDDSLELLRLGGAEIVEFSPIRESLPSDVDGLYIGGGYPELHAEALSHNTAAIASIRDFAAAGGPVYAECGGLMYLAEQLHFKDSSYKLCGVLPFSTRIPAALAIGYVEISTTGGLFGPNHVVRGHVYHHSEIDGEAGLERTYVMRTASGSVSEEGYRMRNVLASYAHLHFASNPAVPAAFVEACARFHERAVRAGV